MQNTAELKGLAQLPSILIDLPQLEQLDFIDSVSDVKLMQARFKWCFSVFFYGGSVVKALTHRSEGCILKLKHLHAVMVGLGG